MFEKSRQRVRVAQHIREAINQCPDGICFCAADGRPILVNNSMNALSLQLTGRTVLNMLSFWEKVARDGEGTDDRRLVTLPDGSVWQFARQVLREQPEKVIQIHAADITELHAYKGQLQENMKKEQALLERQRALLDDIVQNNMERELLHAKIHIHDDFGSVLLMTRSALKKETLPAADAGEVFAAWDNVIADMENAAWRYAGQMEASEKELLHVAEMIGCQIDLRGPRPVQQKHQQLLLAAVREALTNAVRHAGADRLTVEMSQQACGPGMPGWYHVEIRSNGERPQTPVREGNGLGNLRRRLEREGARLRIDDAEGVMLILDMPVTETETEEMGGRS